MAFGSKPNLTLGVTKVGQDELDYLITQLYMIPNKFQFCHHLTTSYSQHKGLDFGYDETSSMKDEIVEKLIGYTGTRFNRINLTPLEGFNEGSTPYEVAQEVISFGKRLEAYAENKQFADICNLAQSYSGIGAKVLYLLSLS